MTVMLEQHYELYDAMSSGDGSCGELQEWRLH